MERRSILTICRQAAALVFLFAFAAVAAYGQRPVMTTHVPEEVTSGIAPLVGHLSGSERLSLAISLPIRNQAELDDLLQQLYDPDSPLYHKYLSGEEFTERFGPTAADYAAVRQFVSDSQLTEIDTFHNRMVLDVEAPASAIEAAFHVTLGLYQHPTEPRTFYAPDREPTPDVNVALLHISGLDNYSIPKPKYIDDAVAKPNTFGSGPGGSFLGSDLRTAYYGSGSLNGAGQIVGIFAFKGYEPSDIDNYFNNAGEPLNVPIVPISVNGASTSCPPSSCNDGEQSLDIEQAISMAPGLSQLSLYVGKSDVSVFNKMADDNTAKSISCSYGWKDNESSLDSIFEQMQTQGQSVFVATGDNGSGTPADVVWPSDDPYVIAVGGTDLTTNGAGGAWKSETGWANSAGMPSPNGVKIPSWQTGPGIITSSNKGSTTLRNIPDVSSESDGRQYVCYQGLCAEHGGGTSYAAPLWAGLIAMANEQAATNGEPTVGFINPVIYALGVGTAFTSDFHDITSGSNGKYSAVKNFDLVTGWGSPQGVNLINALAPPLKK